MLKHKLQFLRDQNECSVQLSVSIIPAWILNELHFELKIYKTSTKCIVSKIFFTMIKLLFFFLIMGTLLYPPPSVTLVHFSLNLYLMNFSLLLVDLLSMWNFTRSMPCEVFVCVAVCSVEARYFSQFKQLFLHLGKTTVLINFFQQGKLDQRKLHTAFIDWTYFISQLIKS